MQTVNFACPHCKNLMAVGMNLLGRNVRCPHCRQVVQAPTTAPGAPDNPAGPVPQFQPPGPPPQEGHESIFGETADEDLFGTRQPRPFLPPEPAPPPPPPPPAPNPWTAAPPPAPAPAPPPPADPWANVSAPSPWEAPPQEAPIVAEEQEPDEPRERRERVERVPPRLPERGGGAGGVLVWVLLLYSILATAGVAFLLFAKPQGPAQFPYDILPDFFGEFEKANRKQTSFKGMPPVDAPLPADLRVQLGHKLTLGDLEVEPLKVEKRAVRAFEVKVGSDEPEQRRNTYPVFLLTLRVKNLSDDVSFHPNDPAFMRRAKDNQPETRPYTLLDVGGDKFYGGIFPWPPTEPGLEYSFVDGQEHDREPLRPHQERTTTVCTRPGERIDDAIRAHPNSPLLWRVQLRRGLVRAPDNQGKEHDVSVTAVIGVEFKASDIQRN